MKPKDRQFILAACLIAFGCGLLVAGFIVAPKGQIHESVLVAFGEIMTFSGAVLGIDYAARSAYYKAFSKYKKENEETEQS